MLLVLIPFLQIDEISPERLSGFPKVTQLWQSQDLSPMGYITPLHPGTHTHTHTLCHIVAQGLHCVDSRTGGWIPAV